MQILSLINSLTAALLLLYNKSKIIYKIIMLIYFLSQNATHCL
ncbi:hypothetical protein EHF_0303 [Ehrlichia japonica]|uniref:Uncharacterized protein n=1 Tax=Ehrlichia japonica TaxID=391036 RepID=X5GBW6_9RICK|nr:hypothetical protein EHF_0303 [Ehrlichia japonica]